MFSFNTAGLPARETTVSFTSSDTTLEKAFRWAKDQALSYRGVSTDKVSPWYEAALPSRFAFCMRAVSHQCIGAEIPGMSREECLPHLKPTFLRQAICDFYNNLL